MVVQLCFGRKIDDASAGTGLGIGGTEHHALDARMQDGADAHGAGLERDIQRAAGKPVVVFLPRRFAQRQNLGVCRGIAGSKRAVASSAYDSALAYDDCPDWNLAQRQRTLRLTKGFLHPEFVGEGHGEEANAATRN